jgi:hypothetical protein
MACVKALNFLNAERRSQGNPAIHPVQILSMADLARIAAAL